MGDTFIISGLREKRSSVAGRIVELRREAEQLEADLFHIDAVLRLYEVEPADIPTKGRVPVRSTYFGRNEITRRIYEVLRVEGSVAAVEIAVQARRDKGIDPANRKLRANFAQRFLTSLHDLRKAGTVERIGGGKGVRWRLAEGSSRHERRTHESLSLAHTAPSSGVCPQQAVRTCVPPVRNPM